MINYIQNDNDYYAALEEIERIMDLEPEPDSDIGRKLNVLSMLAGEYEKNTEISNLPDPVEAIVFRMEQKNMEAKDLIPIIGDESVVKKILSYKLSLTLDMIKSLNNRLDIPFKILIQDYDTKLNNEKSLEKTN